MIYETVSAGETQEIGEKLAKKILKNPKKTKGAFVVALSGDLGGGKTTFVQGFAKGLGIEEKILSPTFVIMKRFEIRSRKFCGFYHIDCYRLKDKSDLEELGIKEILKDSRNIVALEWPERISKILPAGALEVRFEFKDDTTRKISYSHAL